MRLALTLFIAAALLISSRVAAPGNAAILNRDISVMIGGIPVDREAIMRLFRGIYQAMGVNTGAESMAVLEGEHSLRRAKIIDAIDMPRANMPAGLTYFYYAGRDPKTEREIVWQSVKDICTGKSGCRLDDELTAAYALAALDAFYVDGEPWRTLYRSAPDAASRLALGKSIAKAVDEASEQASSRGAEDVAWLRRKIIVGVSRKDTYVALRAFGLVAYNYAYNVGVPTQSQTGLHGCVFPDDTGAAWPYHGEPLPKGTGDCAKSFAGDPGPFPSAYVHIDGGFNISCGSEARVTLDFDTSDRLSKLTVSDFEWSCM